MQGTTVNFMAQKLKLVADNPEAGQKKFRFEELPAEIKSTFSEIPVTADMLVKGDRLMDLPLPEDELVVAVKRDGAFFIPNGSSHLFLNDKLMIISHSKSVDQGSVSE